MVVGAAVWSGVVHVDDDLLVAPGSALTLRPGTRVVFRPALTTKTDPTFWSPGTELAVQGRLDVQGTRDQPVIFEGAGPWGGLVGAPGARLRLAWAEVRGADEGLLCAGAECELEEVRFGGGGYGVVLGPGARLWARSARVDGAQVGVLDARGEPLPLPEGIEVVSAADAAVLVLPPAPRAAAVLDFPGPEGPRAEYLGEYTVAADETWRGEVVLSGRVTVVPGAVLTLAPGTRVAFRRVDTNFDGLGEAELLVLGGIRSLGEPGRPVVFESAEPAPGPGDWDKVSLIASEDPHNLFRHTAFRHGTQALHAHFSRFSAEGCLFEQNLRAVQFQESELAVVADSVFLGNKQALRFRDSRARVVGNRFLGNLYAVHAFRSEVELADNRLEASALGGVLAKESRVSFRRNVLRANRDGARMRDPGSRVTVSGNLFRDSAEDALSLSQVAGEVAGNRFEGAGLDLVSLEDAAVRLAGNDLGPAGRHALHLNGGTDVDATGNHWRAGDPAARIWDGADAAGVGRAAWAPGLKEPPVLDLSPEGW